MKEELELLFKNLYEGKLIFHERVTILCDLIKYELNSEGFSVTLKSIKPLNMVSSNQVRIYNYIDSKSTFSVGSTFEFGDYKILNNKKIGRPYCPYSIWLDPVLVRNVCYMSEQDLKENLSNLLWWTKE